LAGIGGVGRWRWLGGGAVCCIGWLQRLGLARRLRTFNTLNNHLLRRRLSPGRGNGLVGRWRHAQQAAGLELIGVGKLIPTRQFSPIEPIRIGYTNQGVTRLNTVVARWRRLGAASR
jgi:hypothetical protein